MVVEVDFGQDRQRDGQHHQGRGRVGNPHAEGSCGHHESRKQPSRVSSCGHQDVQRKPAVKVPPLQRQGDQKPAKEQEHKLGAVRRRRRRDVRHAQGRKQDQGQHRSDPQRHSFSHPPHQHPGGGRQHAHHVVRRAPLRGRPPRQRGQGGACKLGDMLGFHACKNSLH